jgi:hypothetical protein
MEGRFALPLLGGKTTFQQLDRFALWRQDIRIKSAERLAA